jgi:predicted nucleic acid-binding protein
VTAEAGVLDASVAVKCLVRENGSADALREVARQADWVAPDLILLEVASVALKSMKMGLIDLRAGSAMVATAPALLAELVPASHLCGDAFGLGAQHGFSAYDAAYLALAIRRARPLLTADARLAGRARVAGLERHVRLLGQP